MIRRVRLGRLALFAYLSAAHFFLAPQQGFDDFKSCLIGQRSQNLDPLFIIGLLLFSHKTIVLLKREKAIGEHEYAAIFVPPPPNIQNLQTLNVWLK